MSRRRALGDVTSGAARLAHGLVPLRRATPRRLVRMAQGLRTHGLTLAGLTRLASIRDGRDVVLVDPAGSVTADQLDRWTATVAGELARRELVVAGNRLGVLCHSGRSFLVAAVAASRVGADAVLLHPDMPSAALAEVLRSEDVRVVAHDEDLGELLAAARFRGRSLVADSPTPADRSLRAMAALPQADAAPPRRPGRTVLVANDAGRPRVARRTPPGPGSSLPMTTLLHRLAIRRGSAMLVTVPLDRAAGIGFMAVSLGLGCRAVVPAAAATPAAMLALVAEHDVETIVATPATLVAMAGALGDGAPPSLRAVVATGGRLEPEDWRAISAALGPIVWNLYGGAASGWCTLAAPGDLAEAPGTIGAPAAGVQLRIVDDAGRPVAAGTVGRLHVSSPMAFDAGESGKHTRASDRFIDTGDRAHQDAQGRWFVD